MQAVVGVQAALDRRVTHLRDTINVHRQTLWRPRTRYVRPGIQRRHRHTVHRSVRVVAATLPAVIRTQQNLEWPRRAGSVPVSVQRLLVRRVETPRLHPQRHRGTRKATEVQRRRVRNTHVVVATIKRQCRTAHALSPARSHQRAVIAAHRIRRGRPTTLVQPPVRHLQRPRQRRRTRLRRRHRTIARRVLRTHHVVIRRAVQRRRVDITTRRQQPRNLTVRTTRHLRPLHPVTRQVRLTVVRPVQHHLAITRHRTQTHRLRRGWIRSRREHLSGRQALESDPVNRRHMVKIGRVGTGLAVLERKLRTRDLPNALLGAARRGPAIYRIG